MITYENTLSNYSSATSDQSKLMIFSLFASLCIGSFIGHQFEQFLDVMCAMRGTCYGNDHGFIYNSSLIHPIAIKLFLSSLVLILASATIKLSMPFSALKAAGIISEKDVLQIGKLYTVLIFTGITFLTFSLALISASLLV